MPSLWTLSKDTGTSRQVILPHPLLRAEIAHYTYYSPPPVASILTASTLTILPDASGCLVVLLQKNQCEILLWGPMSQPRQVFDQEECRYFFVEFLPGGLAALLGMDAAELTDKVFDLQDLDTTLYDRLKSLFLREGALAERVVELDRLWLAWGARHSRQERLAIAPFLSYLNQTRGTSSVSQLAETFFISQRQLNRILYRQVGMSAKRLSQIVKINHALPLLRQGVRPLAFVAQELACHDEAHFIHLFRVITGQNPTHYRRNLTDFYNEARKFPT